MKVILFILQKEFIQVLRNRTMLPLIFLLPVVQLLVLVNAATFGIKNIDMVVVDHDMSTKSRELISRFEGSPFFSILNYELSLQKAQEALMDNSAAVVLYIPSDFSCGLVRNNMAPVQFFINAIDGMTAGLIRVYSSGIIEEFSRTGNLMQNQLPLQVSNRFWYNPQLDYNIYMLPGILVILVTITGMFLTAINIVREKELGTIEQINVTPVLKYQFIAGKLLPFLIISLFELAFGLTIGRLLFGLPMLGNLGLLFVVALAFLVVSLALGLLISTISSTQQQVMFTVFFFLLIFILMSGLFTPVESMPAWAKVLNIFNPFQYFMQAIRMILLKGSEFRDVLPQLAPLSFYAVIALSLAVWRYRKTV